jgi:hypothetical protein
MAAERDHPVQLIRRIVERRRIRRLLLELDRAARCDRPLRASFLDPSHRRG